MTIPKFKLKPNPLGRFKSAFMEAESPHFALMCLCLWLGGVVVAVFLVSLPDRDWYARLDQWEMEIDQLRLLCISFTAIIAMLSHRLLDHELERKRTKVKP